MTSRLDYNLGDNAYQIITNVFDFSERCVVNRDGLDGSCKFGKGIIEAFKHFGSASEGFHKLNAVFTDYIDLNKMVSFADRSYRLLTNKNDRWLSYSKASEIFFVCVSCMEATSFYFAICGAKKAGLIYESFSKVGQLLWIKDQAGQFRVSKDVFFALACGFGVKEKGLQIQSGETKEIKKKRKWLALNDVHLNGNSIQNLREYYRNKLIQNPNASDLKRQNWVDKITRVDDGELDIASFYVKVNQKIEYWQEKHVQRLSNMQTDRHCQLLKITSLILDIAIVVFGQVTAGQVAITCAMFSIEVATGAYVLKTAFVVTNLTLGFFGMYKFGHKEYALAE